VAPGVGGDSERALEDLQVYSNLFDLLSRIRQRGRLEAVLTIALVLSSLFNNGKHC